MMCKPRMWKQTLKEPVKFSVEAQKNEVNFTFITANKNAVKHVKIKNSCK